MAPLDREPSTSEAPGDEGAGERRFPVLFTLLVSMTLPFLMPESFSPGPRWLLSSIEGVFLIAMVATDPGRIDRRSAQVRAIRIGLVAVLVSGATWAAASLVDDILGAGPATSDGGPLLWAGLIVWTNAVIAFAFLYWELDAGGPGERAHATNRLPDLAFPQHMAPELAEPGWRPVFFDYLYLALTNGIAFSPTDVMPLKLWAKAAMAAESLASLAIIGLVVARAVNVLA